VTASRRIKNRTRNGDETEERTHESEGSHRSVAPKRARVSLDQEGKSERKGSEGGKSLPSSRRVTRGHHPQLKSRLESKKRGGPGTNERGGKVRPDRAKQIELTKQRPSSSPREISAGILVGRLVQKSHRWRMTERKGKGVGELARVRSGGSWARLT